MARYTHNLMQTDASALQWGIIGAGLLPQDKRMKECLEPQDHLYTLVERSGEQVNATVIGSVTQVIYAGEDRHPLLVALDDPQIRIVSLTVTENGYYINKATNSLDADHPNIAHDIAHPEDSKTAIGIIVAGYARRRKNGLAAFTSLSCDNIQHNGNVLRCAVLSLAQRIDPALAEWIDKHATFPNTMVDRITPVTQQHHIDYLAHNLGVVDRWPVFSEAFTQWVIEDKFAQGRPSWEDVGAQFVGDVAPYELMKLRLLNASHLAIAGLGQLCGYTLIDETMRDERIARYMRALMQRETGPTLQPVPGVDLAVYQDTLIARFANPVIQDTVQRVNTDAPLATLVDSARDLLTLGASIDLLALGIAAWLRRVRGEDEQGRPIEIRHPFAPTLRERALQGGSDPRPLLSLNILFGSLGKKAGFVTPVAEWLDSLYRKGAHKTLDEAATRLAF
eukprot:TRINITY_DN5466_c0_g1_i2.p1 TRINITY_DN5466_c0_g1~~TRINITY_DN5466_c0_g1_i2.p1  ORF type:complete len:495 (+),score=87.47 TRINITY_DN5466_c0_g1_i2:136-1485(+)